MSLKKIEREMATAYAEVHGRKVGALLRKADRPETMRSEEHRLRIQALDEAKGVVAAIKALVKDDQDAP